MAVERARPRSQGRAHHFSGTTPEAAVRVESTALEPPAWYSKRLVGPQKP